MKDRETHSASEGPVWASGCCTHWSVCIGLFKWLLICCSGFRDRKWKPSRPTFHQGVRLEKRLSINAEGQRDEIVCQSRSDSVSSVGSWRWTVVSPSTTDESVIAPGIWITGIVYVTRPPHPPPSPHTKSFCSGKEQVQCGSWSRHIPGWCQRVGVQLLQSNEII